MDFPLKDKEGNTIVNAFQSILSNSKRKPNKIWVDEGSEFYNKSFEILLEDSELERYSNKMKENLLLLKDLLRL